MKNTFISLVPKKDTQVTFEDFKQISLCNTMYKIISKVMANRLKHVLGSIILEEQSGFLPSRSIFEGVVVAHEVVHSIRVSKMNQNDGEVRHKVGLR